MIEPITGPMVCAHLWREADEIVQRFPVVEDLVELMVTQAGFIARECELRERSQGIEAGAPQAQARMTSSVICPLLAQRGYDVSPELLRQWVKRGKITAYVQGGRNYYKLEEILRVGLVDCHGC
ncbi:hypothetical protein I6I10_06950 [Corynebacterium glucuronolyticum]|uniref:Uncharacterized protein n=1 Tax=Corynebacterium glucuronolyticum TaxID=39791 RepID=A0A7T4JW61_9CORY|nr:hypothetical protein [Corynebacterium glucuronolyticum]QQB47596.1 hypothetical protein I6I10_06950 [Corynebacterium glucuronolyticum]